MVLAGCQNAGERVGSPQSPVRLLNDVDFLSSAESALQKAALGLQQHEELEARRVGDDTLDAGFSFWAAQLPADFDPSSKSWTGGPNLEFQGKRVPFVPGQEAFAANAESCWTIPKARTVAAWLGATGTFRVRSKGSNRSRFW